MEGFKQFLKIAGIILACLLGVLIILCVLTVVIPTFYVFGYKFVTGSVEVESKVISYSNETEYSLNIHTNDYNVDILADSELEGLLSYSYNGSYFGFANMGSSRLIVTEGNNELNFSYSGLKTAVINYVHTLEQKGERVNKSDVANSFQHSAIDVLIEKALMAIEKTGYRTLCISGGVGANGYFRDALQKATENEGIKLILPEKRYCTDNAAMIGAEGYLQYKRRNFADLTLNAKAVLPLK